jgi:hypothetical protein
MTNQGSLSVSVTIANPCEEERVLHVVSSRKWNLLIPPHTTYDLKFEQSEEMAIKVEYTEWNGIYVEGCLGSTVTVFCNGENIIPEILLNARSLDKSAIVKEGTFLYDGKVTCDICITKVNWVQDNEFIYYFPEGEGTHMHIAIDRFDDLYCPWYGSTVKRGEFVTSGGIYPSLQEAMEAVMKSPYIGNMLQWVD